MMDHHLRTEQSLGGLGLEISKHEIRNSKQSPKLKLPKRMQISIGRILFEILDI